MVLMMWSSEKFSFASLNKLARASHYCLLGQTIFQLIWHGFIKQCQNHIYTSKEQQKYLPNIFHNRYMVCCSTYYLCFVCFLYNTDKCYFICKRTRKHGTRVKVALRKLFHPLSSVVISASCVKILILVPALL